MSQNSSTRPDDGTDLTLAQRADDLATQAGDGIRAGLRESRATLASLQDAALTRARAAGRAADGEVHDNPWRAIGVAATVGVLIGLLLRRR